MALDPVDRTGTLTEVVYAQLRDAIASQSIPAGSRLTEADVAQQLNVSKTPVREALLRLREVGLIESDGMRGNRVIAGSAAVLREAYETRQVLEGFAAIAAAERASDRQLRRIHELAEQSRDRAEAGDIAGYFAVDRQFHAAIAGAAGNQRVAKLIEDAATLMRVLREASRVEPAGVLRSADQHVAIAAALLRRDPAGATDLMRDHLAAIEQLFTAAV